MNQVSSKVSAQPSVFVVGTGLMTPLGGNTALTLAAITAGINQYQLSSFCNRRSKQMVTSRVPDEALPPLNAKLQNKNLHGREKRMIQMAAPALVEALATYPLEQPVAVFLAGSESLPSGAKAVTSKILEHLVLQTGVNLDLSSSRYFATGRTGVIDALALAFRYFSATKAEYLLIGGVDSYLDAATLGYLDSGDRILAEDATNAFCPGEGAGFILLRSGNKDSPAAATEVCLYEPGIAAEKGHFYSDEPYLGEGLAGAVTAAIANSGSEKISTIYSSMNGESYFAKEYGVAILRNSAKLSEDFEHEHPADCCGDLGAATAPVLIALARSKLLSNDQQTRKLVYCSADFSGRAAVCLTRLP